MTLRVLLLAAALAPVPALAAEPGYHHDIGTRACCLFIAHAGGGIDGIAYTNSEEAVRHHLAAGVRVFEIDFARTRDGVWVGTHDWPLWKRQTGYEGELPPSYAEFARLKLVEHGAKGARSYTGVTIPFLERVVAQRAGVVIVTDTKYDLEALARALRKTKLFPHAYPQAYAPADVELLMGLGYRRIILTVYKMNLRQPDAWLGGVAALAGQLHALTVPLDFFAQHHERLAALGLPVYVHGSPARINARPLHEQLRRMGVAGFYLDSAPSKH